ncbi:MAG TPA: hypothetical protein VMT16_09620 [Thermoanaerobaculia bacterium]|nr:hypothetical protein [Thermoanaerobaculia bacterium]
MIAAGIAWHTVSLLATGWIPLLQETHGRDFDSYHYAARVAAAGGDPYDLAALDRAAAAEGWRVVHPYFYPPPFLLAMQWTLPLDLVTAWRVWFWVDELFLWVVVLIAWAWPVLALALAGLWAETAAARWSAVPWSAVPQWRR